MYKRQLEDLKGLSDLDSAADVIGELNRSGTSLKAAIDTCSSFLSTVATLNETLNQYKEGTRSLLSDCSELTAQLSSTLTSTSAFLQDLKLSLIHIYHFHSLFSKPL